MIGREQEGPGLNSSPEAFLHGLSGFTHGPKSCTFIWLDTLDWCRPIQGLSLPLRTIEAHKLAYLVLARTKVCLSIPLSFIVSFAPFHNILDKNLDQREPKTSALWLASHRSAVNYQCHFWNDFRIMASSSKRGMALLLWVLSGM